MDAITQFAILTITTIIAGALALAMAWSFLCGAFRLMQPAAADRPRGVRSELMQGTRSSARRVV
jgi:hypothetical protein